MDSKEKKPVIVLRIMKKHIIIAAVLLSLISGVGGYYFWCSYHPLIHITVSEGGAGENRKIETPYIAFAENRGIEVAPSIQLKMLQLYDQHEFICQSIKDHYQESDIKLDIEIKDHKTILKYYGTLTTFDNVVEDYKNDVILDFVLDANIEDKKER